MVSDAEMLEVQDAGLARLAQLQLALAEKLYRLADATEDASEAADLATALERASRSVRLTYALRAKLRREGRKEEREETRLAERQAGHVPSRRERLRERVEILTWREADWEDDEALDSEFDRVLDFEALAPDFDSLSLEEQVDRIIAGLDLKAEYPPGYPERSAPPRPGGDPGFQNSA